MAKKSLQYFTLSYITIALFVIIAIWAGIFYAILRHEIYENLDDQLKTAKVNIIRESYNNPSILDTHDFGFNNYRFQPIDATQYVKGNYIFNDEIEFQYDEDELPVRILQTHFIDINGNYQQLEIYTSTIEMDDLTENIIIALLILFFALLLSIIFINHWTFKKAWKSFYSLLQQLKTYKIEQTQEVLSTEIPIREFDELQSEINKMIARNQTTFQQQKQFIGNASHELQTPLAILSNRLENLMQNSELTENNLVELGKIHESLHRLIKLNQSLLFISKVENNQFITTENVNFNLLTQNILDEFSDLIQFKNLKIEKVLTETFETKINLELAQILVSNLIRNAITHTQKNGWIQINITQNQFIIKNLSVSNQALDPTQIFERFHKENQDKNNTGLGLAIVKSIIKLYPSLHIRYKFQEGHIFEIWK